MENPKISVIVPVYNVEKYLQRCMNSLFNQTLKQIEIILVDDESPDNCPAMCDEYVRQDNRVKVVHKKNGGLSYARNSGMELASGKYIAFLDSDDFVKKEMYEKLLTYAESNELDTCFCCTQRYYNSGETVPIIEVFGNKIFNGRNEVDTFLMEMVGGEEYEGEKTYCISAWKAIYSMELINKYDISFLSERIMASEDLFFHIDYLSRAQNVGWLDELLHYYYYNANSISSTYSEIKYNRIKTAMKGLSLYLNKYYSLDYYKKYYYGQLLRYQKVIFNYEIKRKDISYWKIRNILKRECNDPLLNFMSTDFSLKRLPLQKKIYSFTIKHKLVDLIFILNKGKKIIKRN